MHSITLLFIAGDTFCLFMNLSIMAVLSRAEVLQTTIGGIGERCGNAPMEETVLALLTFYGIDVGIGLQETE